MTPKMTGLAARTPKWAPKWNWPNQHFWDWMALGFSSSTKLTSSVCLQWLVSITQGPRLIFPHTGWASNCYLDAFQLEQTGDHHGAWRINTDMLGVRFGSCQKRTLCSYGLARGIAAADNNIITEGTVVSIDGDLSQWSHIFYSLFLASLHINSLPFLCYACLGLLFYSLFLASLHINSLPFLCYACLGLCSDRSFFFFEMIRNKTHTDSFLPRMSKWCFLEFRIPSKSESIILTYLDWRHHLHTVERLHKILIGEV